MASTFLSFLLDQEKKTYDFKIKFADQEPTDEYMDRLEHALATYEVVKMSKPKHIIMGAVSHDFPNFGHCDVYLVSVSLKYPCTDEQLRQVLSRQARIPISNIVVIPCNSPEEQLRDEKLDDVKPKEIDGQTLVGQKRLEALKELKLRKFEFAAKPTPIAKTTNDLSIGTQSPVNGKISIKRI
jgi:hypothetical protein